MTEEKDTTVKSFEMQESSWLIGPDMTGLFE